MLEGCTPWPAEVAEGYRERGYWRGESLAGLPAEWAVRFGQRPAITHGDRRLTYAEFGQRVDRMAAGFRKHGLSPGDRVVIQLPNIPEFIVVTFALFRMGAKPVFSLPAHRGNEIQHLCQVSGATGYVIPGRYGGVDYAAMAITATSRCPALRQVFVVDGEVPSEDGHGAFTALGDVDAEPAEEPPADPSDVAFFLLSGGTTALPKLIPRTHDDYAYQTQAAAELISLSQDDVYLAVLPAGFNFAWGCPGVVGTLRCGGNVVLADEPTATDCFEIIERERVTFTSLVPTIAQLWLDALDADPANLRSLRLIQIGGAPLSRAVAERITPAFGCPLQQVFGMAEGFLSFTRETDAPLAILTTQGRALSPGDEFLIVDESGKPLSPGHTGELLVRGPYTLRGYYQAPEHNARAFTRDGFYRTGDLARISEQGDLVVVGRLKDVIIRGGNKISAGEVEGHLLAHPAVDRAAVVPVPDLYLGERICAYVRPSGDPPTLAGLRAALRERGIADYKLPDRLEIVTDLPLTGLGKVDKKRLAEDAAAKARTRLDRSLDTGED